MRTHLYSLKSNLQMRLKNILYSISRKTHYDTLNVPKNASIKEIKQAFKHISLRSHPDKSHNDTEKSKQFIEANEAHQVLTDPKLKAEYDNSLNSGKIAVPGNQQFEKFNRNKHYTIHQSHFTQKPIKRKYPPPILGIMAILAFMSCLATQLAKNKQLNHKNQGDPYAKVRQDYFPPVVEIKPSDMAKNQ